MKKVLVSFADSRLRRSLERIRSQAMALSTYDELFIFDEYDLGADFQKEFSDVLNSETRGFGYWVWKPQVILQVLSQLSDGDILHYVDVGCHLNIFGRERLLQYFEIASQSELGILAFQARRPEAPMLDDGRRIPKWIDREWTKGDLIDYFNVRDNSDILDTPTIQSGTFFIKKNEATVKFVSKWLQTYRDDFSFADDSPSKSENFPNFKEHRHDQAIFSVMAKIEKASTISASEFWYPIDEKFSRGDWNYLANFPIHARRDLDFGKRINLLRKVKRFGRITTLKVLDAFRKGNVQETI